MNAIPISIISLCIYVCIYKPCGRRNQYCMAICNSPINELLNIEWFDGGLKRETAVLISVSTLFTSTVTKEFPREGAVRPA